MQPLSTAIVLLALGVVTEAWRPWTSYFELEVYVDRLIHEHFNSKKESVTDYVIMFMNSVAIRFNWIPWEIRFPIVKIEVLDNSADNDTFDEAVSQHDVDEVLSRFKKHVNKKKKCAGDAVFLLTMRNLTAKEHGQAMPVNGSHPMQGGMCRKHHRFVVLRTDPSLYSGIVTAVRQLAILLGADKDGEGSAQYCPPYKYYYMSTNDTEAFYYYFSDCSERRIAHYAAMVPESCWKRNGLSDLRTDANVVQLPGKHVKRLTLCHSRFGTTYGDSPVEVCRDSPNGWCATKCCKRMNSAYGSYHRLIGYVDSLDGHPCFEFGWTCYESSCWAPWKDPNVMYRDMLTPHEISRRR